MKILLAERVKFRCGWCVCVEFRVGGRSGANLLVEGVLLAEAVGRSCSWRKQWSNDAVDSKIKNQFLIQPFFLFSNV